MPFPPRSEGGWWIRVKRIREAAARHRHAFGRAASHCDVFPRRGRPADIPHGPLSADVSEFAPSCSGSPTKHAGLSRLCPRAILRCASRGSPQRIQAQEMNPRPWYDTRFNSRSLACSSLFEYGHKSARSITNWSITKSFSSCQALPDQDPFPHSHAPHISHSHTYEDSDFSEIYEVDPKNHSIVIGPRAPIRQLLPAGAGLRARVRCFSEAGFFSNWTAWSRSVG